MTFPIGTSSYEYDSFSLLKPGVILHLIHTKIKIFSHWESLSVNTVYNQCDWIFSHWISFGFVDYGRSRWSHCVAFNVHAKGLVYLKDGPSEQDISADGSLTSSAKILQYLASCIHHSKQINRDFTHIYRLNQKNYC